MIAYDTKAHKFVIDQIDEKPCGPYSQRPVLLNIVVTHDCNMDCDHCVAKDFGGVEQQDIQVTHDLLAWINEGPFLVVVLTGGEPLLHEHQDRLLALLEGIHDKGVMLDTNGTIWPRDDILRALKSHNALVRISLDSLRPQDDTELRHAPGADREQRLQEYQNRLRIIDSFVDAGIYTAVQTVVYRSSHKNADKSLDDMAVWLRAHNIKGWHLQRLIPSYRLSKVKEKYNLSWEDYETIAYRLTQRCQKEGIECVAKKDQRHNSVFLLLGEGVLYTQGPSPGQKVPLGTIHEELDFFSYVSASDHAMRYYGHNGE